MNSNPELTKAVVDRLVAHLAKNGQPRKFFTITTIAGYPDWTHDFVEELKRILGGQEAFDAFREKFPRSSDGTGWKWSRYKTTFIVPEQSKGLALNLLHLEPMTLYVLGFVLQAILEPGEFLTLTFEEGRHFTAHLAGPSPEAPIVLNG